MQDILLDTYSYNYTVEQWAVQLMSVYAVLPQEVDLTVEQFTDIKVYDGKTDILHVNLSIFQLVTEAFFFYQQLWDNKIQDFLLK